LTNPLNGTTLVTATTYTDAPATAGKYFYVVTSVENGAESIASNEVSVSLLPLPPTNLHVVSAS